MDEKMTVMRAENVTKVFKTGELKICALDGVSLKIKRGDFLALAGPSGSGKSTFLNIISGLDMPTGGRVYLGGKILSEMSGAELSDYRRDHIGFIFQSYNLIPVLTVKENIEYILVLQGLDRKERDERVDKILEEVGLMGTQNRRPIELSGGQQQRVAVARAVASRPDIILADEPTANLDSATGTSLVNMMRDLNESKGMTFLFSTHDQKIMDRAKRLVVLKDGKIESDQSR